MVQEMRSKRRKKEVNKMNWFDLFVSWFDFLLIEVKQMGFRYHSLW